jgi:formate dehydrogenase subunit beta
MKTILVTIQDSSINSTVRKLIQTFMEKKSFQAVLAPVRIPGGDSFAYELMSDKTKIEQCGPLPPIMPIPGARVLKDLTRKGEPDFKILCIMHPCEIRAAVELAKLRQVNLNNITFMSFDCPGAFPTKDYVTEPKKYDISFDKILKTLEGEGFRTSCTTCINFSHDNIRTDIHIANLGMAEGKLMLQALSAKGEECLSAIDMELTDDTVNRQEKINSVRKKREANREKLFSEINSQVKGIDNLDIYFAECINCHNCMRVCPICYCRQCFFDSADSKRVETENYLSRAHKKGGIAFPADTLLFHLGRMSHMNLSCIGCGACEDACAMDVPVAQIFNFMADKLQKMFEYIPGRNIEEKIPVLTYTEDEFHEYEDAKEKQ